MQLVIVIDGMPEGVAGYNTKRPAIRSSVVASVKRNTVSGTRTDT